MGVDIITKTSIFKELTYCFLLFQVWFQNARAKYRRGVLKDPSGREISGSGSGVSDDGNMTDIPMTDLGNQGSPAMSDISPDISMSEHLHDPSSVGPIGHPHQTSLSDQSDQSAGSTLTELFTNSINTIN